MPTLAEQIASANAKLTSLLETATQPAADDTREVSSAEALQLIGAELATQGISKERRAYLTTALQEITKALSFEDVNEPLAIKITVIESDADKISPVTATGSASSPESMPKPSVESANRKTLDLTTIGDNTAVTSFSSNLAKAEAIQKLLVNKVELRKSKVTDKIDEIKKLFGVTDDDLEGDEYQLRWKIGQLINLLLDAARLEALTGSEIAKSSSTSAPETKREVWPADMASAQFDEKAGVFKNDALRWGLDGNSERA